MRILFVVILVLSLTACGGGGGGGGGGDDSSFDTDSANGSAAAEVEQERLDEQEELDESRSEDEFANDDSGETSPAVNTTLRNCGSPARPLKIMPFGDSITEAERGHNSYRRSLWFQLHEAGCIVDFVGTRLGVSDGSRNTGGQRPPDPGFDLDHEGRWDYRADELIGLAANAVASEQPDVILIHVGTNDLLRGQSVASTAQDIGAIIDSVRLTKPDIIILVAQLIPASSIRSDIIELNALIPGVVALRADSQSPLVVVDQFTGYFSEDNYDGLHPAKSGEGKIASNWTNAILELVAGE